VITCVLSFAKALAHVMNSLTPERSLTPARTGTPATSRAWAKWWIVAILICFVTLGMAYNVINPSYEATDELRHFRFVRTIAQTGRLPVQGQEACRSQSHHPPLFYALGALATFWIDTGPDLCYTLPQNPFWAYRYWEVGVDNKNQYLHGPEQRFPWQGDVLAVRLIRAINVLIGAAVVWLTWATGRAAWPDRPQLALGAVAFVAFNPMFLYMSASINNDVIAAFSGAAATLAGVRLLQSPTGLSRRWGIVFGAIYGVALMSKFNMAFLILLLLAAVTWVAWQRRQWRLWLEVNGLMVAVAGVLAGWWFLRNYGLYGDPTGFRMVTELWGVRNPWQSFGLAVQELPYVWTSLWGRFGFGQIPLPPAVYSVLYWLTLVAFGGVVLSPLLRRRLPSNWSILLFLLLNVLLVGAVLFGYMLVSPAGPMGRFFFPALPAFALLLFYGLAELLEFAFQKGQGCIVKRLPPTLLLASLANVAMLAFSLLALFGYIAPAYARPPAIAAGATIPNPANVRFDALATLLGYEVSGPAVRPGEVIEVKLFWQVEARPPGNYLLFIHLVDDIGAIITQRDTHPGLGNFPTSQWRPGDRFVETIRLHLPETAYAPATATLQMGLYAPAGYRLAISDQDGAALGDALTLAPIELRPWHSVYPNAQAQNFGNEIRLAGFDYSGRTLRPGDSLGLTLYWEALAFQPGDYLIEARLMDSEGKMWATADDRPQNGRSPTSSWQRGDVVKDERWLTLLPALPAGAYRVEIAVVDPMTNGRLNIVAEDGHFIDNRLLLGQVRVLP
jgi:4-amino-4-deoxy-L-arabinose transferase-like glycosyltransferase